MQILPCTLRLVFIVSGMLFMIGYESFMPSWLVQAYGLRRTLAYSPHQRLIVSGFGHIRDLRIEYVTVSCGMKVGFA